MPCNFIEIGQSEEWRIPHEPADSITTVLIDVVDSLLDFDQYAAWSMNRAVEVL